MTYKVTARGVRMSVDLEERQVRNLLCIPDYLELESSDWEIAAEIVAFQDPDTFKIYEDIEVECDE